MAHNSYPAGTPTGVVPPLYVLPSTDWAYVIACVFKAANFDDGGTWAPGAFITVGGSGFQLTGTGHTIASAATLNIANGGTIKADAAGGPIYLRVVSGIARLDVESGAVATVKAGAALDVFGSLTVKTAGPGAATWESGTNATWALGSSLTANAGSTVNLNGATNIRGEARVRSTANGGPGSVIFEADSSLTMQASSTGTIAGAITYSGASAVVFDGTTTFGTSKWPQLTPARPIPRHATSIALCSFDNSSTDGPVDPDAWFTKSDLGNTPCVRTRSATNSGDFHVEEFTDLPQGATIVEVEVDTFGGNSNVPNYPTYRLVKWQAGDTTFTNLSILVTDEHDGTGTWNSATETTTITPTTTTTIDRGWRYGIYVAHPYAALSSSMRVNRCEMSLTVAELRA